MLDPAPVSRADYLVVKSTYGDRKHDPRDPRGRASRDHHRDRPPRRHGSYPRLCRWPSTNAPLSPAAASSKPSVYRVCRSSSIAPWPSTQATFSVSHIEDHRLSRRPSAVPRARLRAMFTTVEKSKTLNVSPMPKMIISASGMATGGRVLHHLKHSCPNPKNTILFSGFQAGGTRGEAMTHGAELVKIHGEYVPVRAEVQNLRYAVGPRRRGRDHGLVT